MKINENIKKYRKLKQMTLEELGKLCGTTKQTIARYESGEIANIPYDRIISIADALNVHPSDLMGWSNIEYNINEPENDGIQSAELVKIYLMLNDNNKANLTKYANYLLSTQ